MTRLGDLFLIPEWTPDERENVARLLSRIESIALDLGSRIDAQGSITQLRAGSITLDPSGLTVTVGGNQQLLVNGSGVTIGTGTSGPLRFANVSGVASGTAGMEITSTADDLQILNYESGEPILLRVTLTNATLRSLTLGEDAGLANRVQLDLGVGAAGTKLTIGGEVEIHGGAGGVTTVFNEAGRDIDFRVEGDTVTDVLVVDAGKDVAYFRGIGARVYNDANISIPNDTLTALTFNTERFDTDSIHSAVSNTGRLTCQTAGKYIIGANVRFDLNATGQRIVRLRVDGTTYIASVDFGTDSVSDPTMAPSTIWDMAVGSYVECVAYQNSGGALNVEVQASWSPEFWMQRIG